MKKLLLFLSCFITALVMFAQGKVYTEQLVLTINGEISAPQDAGVVVVDNGNNTINFVLKNFFLVNGENTIPVGNISVENLPVKKGEDGLDYITFDGSITIQPGDMEGVASASQRSVHIYSVRPDRQIVQHFLKKHRCVFKFQIRSPASLPLCR